MLQGTYLVSSSVQRVPRANTIQRSPTTNPTRILRTTPFHSVSAPVTRCSKPTYMCVGIQLEPDELKLEVGLLSRGLSVRRAAANGCPRKRVGCFVSLDLVLLTSYLGTCAAAHNRRLGWVVCAYVQTRWARAHRLGEFTDRSGQPHVHVLQKIGDTEPLYERPARRSRSAGVHGET